LLPERLCGDEEIYLTDHRSGMDLHHLTGRRWRILGVGAVGIFIVLAALAYPGIALGLCITLVGLATVLVSLAMTGVLDRSRD
jgi:hypothetical protein